MTKRTMVINLDRCHGCDSCVAVCKYTNHLPLGEYYNRVVAVIGIVFALLLGYFCGHGYVMPGRPEWQTNFLPLAYCGTTLAAGGFLFAIIQIATGSPQEEFAFTVPWCVVAAVVCAIVCTGYSYRVRTAVFNAQEVAINVQADIDRSAEALRADKAQLIFIMGLVICGVPAVLIFAVQAAVGGASQRMAVFAVMTVLAVVAAADVLPFSKMWDRDMKKLEEKRAAASEA